MIRFILKLIGIGTSVKQSMHSVPAMQVTAIWRMYCPYACLLPYLESMSTLCTWQATMASEDTEHSIYSGKSHSTVLFESKDMKYSSSHFKDIFLVEVKKTFLYCKKETRSTDRLVFSLHKLKLLMKCMRISTVFSVCMSKNCP